VFKKILKWILNAGLVVLGIAVALVGLVLLANSRLFDEAPHPEIAAFMQIEASKVPDEQNAYFHLIGLGAPEAEQPHAAGQKWIAAANDAQVRRMKGDIVKWPEEKRAKMMVLPDICRPEVRSCLQQAREKPDAMRKLVADNERLIGRYRAAHAYSAYAEPVDGRLFEYPTPIFSVSNVQRLFLMDAALRLEQGEREAVLADLGKDIALGRRMLDGARSVMGKMVAYRHVSRSVLFAADVLARHREQAGAAGLELQALLQPLTPPERQIGDTIRHEFRGTKLGTEHMVQYPSEMLGADNWALSWIGRALFQPNASFNYIYLRYQAQHAADLVPAGQLDATLLKGAPKEPDPSAWTRLYDPVGKNNVRVDFLVDFSDYIRRMHDFDALVRLAALQAEIVAKNVKDEDVPQFLAAADKRYANPWTEKPMQWDPKSRQIYFEPVSKIYKDDKPGGVAGRVSISL
jgi:hypothetical protein